MHGRALNTRIKINVTMYTRDSNAFLSYLAAPQNFSSAMAIFSTIEHLVAFVVSVMYLSMAAIGGEDASKVADKASMRFANANLVAATAMIMMSLRDILPEFGQFVPKAQAAMMVVFAIMYVALSANTLKKEQDAGGVPASRKHYVVANVIGSALGLLASGAAAYGIFKHGDARALTRGVI